jgi:DNA mismatch repair protein MutS
MKSKSANISLVSEIATTPLMEQYLKIKSEYRDAILLYRMGDFYETFFEDAVTISKILGIALTKRAHGKSSEVPLAGFPHHALDNYLHKLVKKGYRVAICEQIEDPRLAKGVVKRDVIEVVSPGATLSDKLLENNKNNFLAAIVEETDNYGLALADISTGEFYATEIKSHQLEEQLNAFYPREIVLKKSTSKTLLDLIKKKINAIITFRDDWLFNLQYGRERILEHFQTHSLKGYGLQGKTTAVIAAGAILHYLKENYKAGLAHFTRIQVLNLSQYMVLDDATKRNLEIVSPLREDLGANTLIAVIDLTRTAMGGRMMRHWLNQPLRNAKKINSRLDIVSDLYNHKQLRETLKNLLNSCSDMERLIGKIVTGRANGRDLNSLKNALSIVPKIKQSINESSTIHLKSRFTKLFGLPDIVNLIEKAIVEEPPLTITEGGIIRSGYNKGLDEIREIAQHGKKWIVALQEEQRRKTGITSLKVNYNKVFGYYIEVTKTHLEKVPSDYIRKQTLVNAERYITPDLKEKEEKILGAEERIQSMEYEIFQELRKKISKNTDKIQHIAKELASLDCMYSLAEIAAQKNYVRPEVIDGVDLEIINGRHPVVEHFMPPGEVFVENSVKLNPAEEQIWIITGPNMAGKSTFLRQTGLIVFLSQIGSFIPAEKATIGTVDRIFTRVGASDNLAGGESTFLVEMNETANILNNATSRSLVLLDEIGRGTSTFDGLSIAWAVAEYLHNEITIRPKTLFATHYHELTELALLYPRIRNYNIAVEEWENNIIFLRKIVPGGTDNSYGIHVAQMAGLPFSVIERAREILSNLESNELTPNHKPRLAKRRAGRSVDTRQLTLFKERETSEVENKLKNLDVNRLSPIEALIKLDELKKMVQNE